MNYYNDFCKQKVNCSVDCSEGKAGHPEVWWRDPEILFELELITRQPPIDCPLATTSRNVATEIATWSLTGWSGSARLILGYFSLFTSKLQFIGEPPPQHRECCSLYLTGWWVVGRPTATPFSSFFHSLFVFLSFSLFIFLVLLVYMSIIVCI